MTQSDLILSGKADRKMINVILTLLKLRGYELLFLNFFKKGGHKII